MASISTASGSNEDKTLRGGDVRIIKLDLQDSNHEKIYDLTSIWKNISIYEDIETNYIVLVFLVPIPSSSLSEFLPHLYVFYNLCKMVDV